MDPRRPSPIFDTTQKSIGVKQEKKHLQSMIHNSHFTLITDNKPVVNISGSKTGVPVYPGNSSPALGDHSSNASLRIPLARQTPYQD
ncbi:hypothetical protein X801_06372, partial [Opisthorchis viverrini]